MSRFSTSARNLEYGDGNMEKVKNQHIYYRIISPRGVESDELTENDARTFVKQGRFFVWVTGGNYTTTGTIRTGYKWYKVGKVIKYTERLVVTEEEVTF